MRHDSRLLNESMRDDLKVQLPVPIDTKKYLIGRIAFVDVFLASPFLLITALFLYLLYGSGMWNITAAVFLCLPAITVILALATKHPVRKEISFVEYGLLWRLFFKKRQKEFFKRKGEIDMSDIYDSRKVMGLKGVYLDCYETSKNLVRVFEVSSINLSLANKSEKKATLDTFKVFLTSSDFFTQLQFCKIAQPINLDRHLQNFRQGKRKENIDEVKSMLIQSYEKSMLDLGKSRNLVARKNYIILTQPIKNKDKDKALLEIDNKSAILVQKLGSLVFDQSSLTVKQLNSEELTLLFHTTIDYDSAVSVGSHILRRANSSHDVSMGEESMSKLIESLQRDMEHIIQ
ncbi:hypothetical protein [Exiguobacterium sp. BG5(2022)]|uniref:hypothetical protein n=1 Tax=Exiguobacterium sp. BG5(2022) TaxID=2962595 RepID=UPI0028821E41|nr:hypothetical protein [Exiguobacterium sp. BG5(2022)]MDT0193672.1 hypothetical protein [Exiguobacterium sp. BG5(2022)]